MKNIKSIFTLLVAALIGLSLTACSEDDLDTNQYQQGVHLNVWGPNPVMYGGTIMFKGSNLDQIAQIKLPGCDPITNIEVVQSGIPSEIRIQVPEEAIGEDYVTLTTKTDDVITTQTMLSFEQGMELTSISPASVMPGEEVTLTGEYLHLAKCIVMEGDTISSDDFTAQSRSEIKFVAGETARTGNICVLDLDLTKLTQDELNEATYNEVESEEVIEIGTPTVDKVTTPRGEATQQETVMCKQGETITITGKYFNLVNAIVIGDADNESSIVRIEADDIDINEEGTSLTFTLPAEAPDGDINIECRSGVEVPAAILETITPSECVASPTPVKNGQTLTISGQDLDVVTTVEMPNVTDDIEFNYADGKVIITAVPTMAQEGNLVLRMANGKGVEVTFTLVKPTITAYSPNPVSAGGALTITGTDLDLVSSIAFGEGSDAAEVEASEDGKSLTLTVPMNASSGAPTLTLINGTTIEAATITIEEAVFCYATSLPDADTEIKAGSTLTLSVANIDKLTGVQINGTDCQYIQSENTVIIGVPETAGSGAKVRLVSSNGEITYTIDIIPATEVSTTVWSGMTELTWGTGGRVIISASDFENVPAGAIMTLCYTQKDQTWAQAQINYADWSGINFTEGDIKFNQTLVPTDVYGWFEDGILNRETQVVLTQEILDNILAKRTDISEENATDCGIIIQGSDLIFTKVTISYTRSLEETIWTGSWACSGWGGNQDLAWGGYDWSSVKANATIRFYWSKITTGSWACISLRHGNGWGNLPDPISSQYDLADEEDSDVLEVQLSQGVLDDLVNNGGLVLTGDNYTLTKVTIE